MIADTDSLIARVRSQESIETRLLDAWRKSALPLPVLLARAAERYEILGAHQLAEMSDVVAVEMVERYVEEHCQ